MTKRGYLNQKKSIRRNAKIAKKNNITIDTSSHAFKVEKERDKANKQFAKEAKKTNKQKFFLFNKKK